MPVEFLTDEEAASYGRYNEPPPRAEMERAFFLDDADKALIVRRRGGSQPRRLRVQSDHGPLVGFVPGRTPDPTA